MKKILVFAAIAAYTFAYINGNVKDKRILMASRDGSGKRETEKYRENPSGSCGPNLEWRIDVATSTLIINGTGEMTDYDSPKNTIFGVISTPELANVGLPGTVFFALYARMMRYIRRATTTMKKEMYTTEYHRKQII